MRLRVDLATLLEAQAASLGERPFLVDASAEPISFAELNRRANRLAHGLTDVLGVRPGDRVAIMMRNRPEFVEAAFAIKKLGAVEVAINTEFRGVGLAHTLGLTGAAVLLADAEFCEPVLAVAERLPALRTIAVVDEPPPLQDPRAISIGTLADLRSDRDDDPRVERRALEVASVLFTSGTTGPSKGCMLSHRYATIMAEGVIEALDLTADDCLYCPFPLYHIDAAFLTVLPALVTGGRAAVGRRFSARGFWPEVRAIGATVFDFMGATLTILSKAEPSDLDRDNPVRLAWGVPMPQPAWRRAFEERFGLRLVHNYGLTDAGSPCWESLVVEEPAGSCGKAVPPFGVRVLDDAGHDVPRGETGQIAVRSKEPGGVMNGYWGMEEATREVMVGEWLLTGDLGRLDAEGHLFFVARMKDAIRRRGQNISAWEIEQVVNAHPAVLESVAVGVPSELSEEDVKIVVVLRPGASLSPDELTTHCEGRMASYMIPEYVVIVNEIPKTATGKPQKYKLDHLA